MKYRLRLIEHMDIEANDMFEAKAAFALALNNKIVNNCLLRVSAIQVEEENETKEMLKNDFDNDALWRVHRARLFPFAS